MPRIEVRACNQCPFFVQTLGSVLAGIFTRTLNAPMGECDYPDKSGVRCVTPGQPGPDAEAIRDRKMRRLRVFKMDEIPEKCPLLKDHVVVVAMPTN